MTRRLIGPGVAAALALSCVVGVHLAQAASAVPKGVACQKISGTATISPGLTTTAKSQSVTISSIALSGCQGGSAGAPGLPKIFSGTATTSPNPVTTKASCAAGNLVLSSTINWSTGTSTGASITTTGLTASQTLKGAVTSSTNPDLAPGNTVAGEVVFKPTTTAQNCAKVAVTAVTFQGTLAAGAP